LSAASAMCACIRLLCLMAYVCGALCVCVCVCVCVCGVCVPFILCAAPLPEQQWGGAYIPTLR
jgi:hypothetical protein